MNPREPRTNLHPDCGALLPVLRVLKFSRLPLAPPILSLALPPRPPGKGASRISKSSRFQTSTLALFSFSQAASGSQDEFRQHTLRNYHCLCHRLTNASSWGQGEGDKP